MYNKHHNNVRFASFIQCFDKMYIYFNFVFNLWLNHENMYVPNVDLAQKFFECIKMCKKMYVGLKFQMKKKTPQHIKTTKNVPTLAKKKGIEQKTIN